MAECVHNCTVMIRFLLLAYLYVVAAIAAPGAPFSTRVIGVTDGDTITVVRTDGSDRDPIRVRLYGIDILECRQRFYARAKQFTSDLVFDRIVRVIPRGKHFSAWSPMWCCRMASC